MQESFLRGAFVVWADGMWLRGGREREWEGARGAEKRETAKRAAGIDAGVRGRDASGWSESWSLSSGCGCSRGMDRYKNDFIRAPGCRIEKQCGATADTTASAHAGPSTAPFVRGANDFARDDIFECGQLQRQLQGQMQIPCGDDNEKNRQRRERELAEDRF
jgi:hypothetical protein